MLKYIVQYVNTYNFCLHTKPAQYLLFGKLYFLLIPNTRWEIISIDFIVELSEFVSFNIVMTVVNLVSKRIYFILMHMTITVEDTVRLLLHNMWKLYGFSTHIVLDRELQFIAWFTKKLYHLLGIEIASSTAWHLQSDEQIEYVNQKLDQYLQLFVNKRQSD